MTIALISPKGVGMGRAEENTQTANLYSKLSNINSLQELMACPNSPLLTIASMAKPYFDTIEYLDEEVDSLDFSKGYDIVAMSFMTQQATRAYELAAQFRHLGSYTICGGMHPTSLPDEASQYFDTVFVGECENTWRDFIRDYQRGTPHKIYRNQAIIAMEQVPMPSYELLRMEKYRTIPVQISRGCPHNCAFCASTKVYGPQYRHKSVSQILDELAVIQRQKTFPHIYFTDDNMLVQKKFSLELLEAFQGQRMRWMTHTDIGVAEQKEILSRLYAAGCRKVVIGFESIVSDSLLHMEKWKYARLPQYAKAIETIQSYGIGVWGTFIVGLDHDDRSVFQKVIDFTLENHLYGAMISVPTPFPGSALYAQLEREGRILTKHWGSYTLWNVVVSPKNMTAKDLEDGFSRTLRAIYSKEASHERLEYFKELWKRRQTGP